MRQGKSFSGGERNCVFLNTGADGFENVSTISGFDFKDDCRGIACIDWDYDGRPDYWVTNRSGPTLRLMRNTLETQNHFVAFRLIGNGESTNRDAVGARVQVILRGEADTELKRVKSVRAGNGFLSQSSKWLHFGLGDAPQIERVIVRWPDGSKQELDSIAIDQWYTVNQQHHSGEASVAKKWTPPAVVAPAAPPEPPEIATPPQRTLVSTQVPMPEMLYQTFKGHAGDLGAPAVDGRPMLVTFWATRCPVCLAELVELRDHATELNAAKLNVLALSVDGLGDRRGVNEEETLMRLARLDFPFAGGMATEDIIQKVHLLDEFVHDRQQTLAVPISLLISSQGQLAAFYEGPVSPETVIADVASLLEEDRLATALPYPGNWLDPPKRIGVNVLGNMFMQTQNATDAERYFRAAYEESKGAHRSAAIEALAECLGAQGRLNEAAVLLEAEVEANPQDLTLLANLVDLLMGLNKTVKAQLLAQQGVALQPHNARLQVLLGHTQLSQKQHEQALASYNEAIELAPNDIDAHLGAAQAAFHLNRPQLAYATLERVCNLFPEDAGLRATIASGFAENGDDERAAYYLQEAIMRDDQDGQAHFELARCYDRLGDLEGADEHYRKAAELSPDQPVAINQYGITLARQERYEEAIRYFRRALELNPNYDSAKVNLRRAQELRRQSK